MVDRKENEKFDLGVKGLRSQRKTMKMPEPQERTRTQVSIGLSFAFDCSEVGASFLIMQSHFLRDIQHQGFF